MNHRLFRRIYISSWRPCESSISSIDAYAAKFGSSAHPPRSADAPKEIAGLSRITSTALWELKRSTSQIDSDPTGRRCVVKTPPVCQFSIGNGETIGFSFPGYATSIVTLSMRDRPRSSGSIRHRSSGLKRRSAVLDVECWDCFADMVQLLCEVFLRRVSVCEPHMGITGG